MLHFNLFW